MYLQKRYLIPLLSFIVLFTLLISDNYTASKHEVLTYLEDKYNEEFIIEDKQRGNIIFPSFLGRNKYYAYPKGNKDLLFLVTQVNKKENNFVDTYILSKWGKDLEIELEEVLKDVLPENSQFKIAVFTEYDNLNSSLININAKNYLKQIKEDTTIVLQVIIEANDKSEVGKYNQNLANAYNTLKRFSVNNIYLIGGFMSPYFEDISEYLRGSFVYYHPWEDLDDEELFRDVLIKDRSVAELTILTPDRFINYDED